MARYKIPYMYISARAYKGILRLEYVGGYQLKETPCRKDGMSLNNVDYMQDQAKPTQD